MSIVNQPSEAELEILQVIWEKEPVTVRQIHEVLLEKKKIGYTTTLKQIQRMTEKGMLERTTSGKAHLYKAIVKEQKVQETLFQRFVNSAFKGSAMQLVMHALGHSETTKEEIEALENFLQQQKSQKNDNLTE